jgi:hypothetical protein
MHHLRPRLALFAAFGLSLLAGCFSPELPATITCGLDGTCPPGLRCETSANICVDPNQAGVAELHFEAQPASVEAGVDAPEIVVQLRDAAGNVVPVTGGTFAVELAAHDAGVNLLGSAIRPAARGVVTFDKLRFDHPARGLRLVVHGGDFSATSAAFDVTTTRPAVLAISVGGVVDSCATVTYQLQQAQSLPVDLLVEFDPDGAEGPLPYRRATQAASAPGKAGVAGVPGSPEGRALTFTWDTSADVGAFDAAGRLRITPSLRGVAGKSFEAPVTVRNGARFYSLPGEGSGVRHLIDSDYDGIYARTTVSLEHHLIGLDTFTFFVPEGASVDDYAVGDFDGDARVDVVVSLSTGTVVQRQLHGSGVQLGPIEPVAGRFRRVMTDDLDRDGLADIIGVEEGSGDVVILRSSRHAPGTMVEALRPWRGGASSVELADLDRDGWKDLVIARASATSPVVVVRGSAAGIAEATPIEGLKGSVVAVADVDLDGRDDVASLDAAGLHVAASAAGRVDVPGITGTIQAIHDVNADRLPDVLVAEGDSVYVHAHVPARHSVSFVPAALVGTAPGTTELVVGEQDGVDDRADIFALANGDPASKGELVLFRNTTPRRCSARLGAPLTSGLTQGGLALAELNGDGKIDRVTPVGGLGRHWQLVVDLGHGDGTFEHAVAPIYEWAENVFKHLEGLADLDGDGMTDLVLVAGSERVVTVLYNDRGSPGTFTPVDFSFELPEALAVADLEGDGVLDLVVLDAGRVKIRHGDPVSRRAFGPPVVLPEPFDDGGTNSLCRDECRAYVTDLDADGHLDILVKGVNELFYYRADAGAADGYAAPVVASRANGWLVGLDDITDDGRPEVLVYTLPTESAPGHLSGLELTPAGTALEPGWSIETEEPLEHLVDIDLDGDGVKETIVQGRDSLLTHGPRPELRPLPFGLGGPASPFVVADVNSDGHDDLLAMGPDITVVRFDEHGPMDLATLLTPRGSGDPGGFGNEVSIGDFDGDDLPDLAIRDSADGQMILKRQAGAAPGTLAPDEIAVAGLYSSALADVDGDRRADLVTYGENESLFYLDPGAPATHGQCVSDFPSYPYAVGDVDRDGRPDIVEATWTDVVLRRDPVDACAPPVVVMSLDATPGSTWLPKALRLADMNHDGFLDVVIATDAVRVALQDPDAPGTFRVTDYEVQTRTDYAPYYDFEVADLNHDTALDVVVLDASYAVRIFSGIREAPGQLAPSTVMAGNPEGYFRQSVSVGDVNDDGHPDIVVGGSYRSEVFLQQSNPDFPTDGGPFVFAYQVPSAEVPQYDAERAIVVDFDRDGRNDVVYVDPRRGTMLLKGR